MKNKIMRVLKIVIYRRRNINNNIDSKDIELVIFFDILIYHI